MNKIGKILLFFSLVTGTYSTAMAQQERVVLERPFVTRNLSGTVTDRNGGLLSGVTVIRFSSKWSKEIERAETDAEGKFKFSSHGPGLYYFQLWLSGFDELQIKIRVMRGSKKRLMLTLPIAT